MFWDTPIVNQLWDFRPTDDGGIIATGKTVTERQGQPGFYTTFWLLKLDSLGCLTPGCDSLDIPCELPSGENSLTANPNPASGTVYVQTYLTEETGTATVALYDVSGRKLYQQTAADKQTLAYDTRRYAPGLYIFTLEKNGRVLDKRKVLFVE